METGRRTKRGHPKVETTPEGAISLLDSPENAKMEPKSEDRAKTKTSKELGF